MAPAADGSATGPRVTLGEPVPVRSLTVHVYTVPTDEPESDGTLAWDSTTMVLVEAAAGDTVGLGYTYGSAAVGTIVRGLLAPVVEGRDALDVPACWSAMVGRIRNQGRPGIASMAIAAVDNALWDLKARLLGVALASLLGRVRSGVPVYGSGGFTSYSLERLAGQLAGWVAQGIGRVKMKIARRPDQDEERLRVARSAIGSDTELLTDANGAYTRKQALEWLGRLHDHGVVWLEEPVSSADLEGMRLLRDRGPGGLDIASGEYGYSADYFRAMLQAQAVDVLQADATRCAGITGFLQAAALCEAFDVPFSAHCAPAVHAHAGCAARKLRHLEYFHDHARIEGILFDGTLSPDGGELVPDTSRPGNGLELKRSDAQAYAA